MPRGGSVDDHTVGQRVLTLAAALTAAAVGAAVALGASGSLPNWAAPQISTVVAHGLMDAKSTRTFHPNSTLSKQTLATLSFDLKQELGPPATAPTDSSTTSTSTDTTATSTTPTPTTTPPTVPNPAGQVSMAQLDRQLVSSLSLGQAAKEFAQGARAAGTAVSGRFGTEVVARLLGLRINHPASQDFLELRPQDPATRAEAAYSAAQILGFGLLQDSWEIEQVQSLASSFELPQLNDWQRRILNVAFSKIGMPYIWGGTSDGAETEFGVSSRGGYDCSGFVWRVYKLQSYPNEGSLASTLRGRTTYTMSVEVPHAKRIPFAKLQPADVIFFGTKGAQSTGPQIFHTAIYVGNGWFIQSSGEGVALAQLSGWYQKRFAWGRRPLKEAGLEP
jgi:cell wall-associated NlpC family hydrolase